MKENRNKIIEQLVKKGLISKESENSLNEESLDEIFQKEIDKRQNKLNNLFLEKHLLESGIVTT